MRVLFVPSGDDKYGAPRSMMELIKNLKDRHNIEPVVVTSSHNGINSWCDENNIESHVLGYGAFMVVGGSNSFRKIVKHAMYPLLKIQYLKKDAEAKAKIEELFGDRKFDIVHTNVNRIDIGAYYAQKHSVPHVWHLREFGKEDYNCMYLRSDTIQFMNANTTRFVSISDAVKKAWADKGLEIGKIQTIYNGIDLSKFQGKVLDRPETPKKRLELVFAGIISETKGQMQLIEAIEKLSNEYRSKVHVDFYGGGRERYINQLKKYVASRHLENVIDFKGYVNNMSELLPDYDVGVVCSRAEAFGRVTAEYMASGLCVIASDTGANPELINHNKNGLLYRWNDTDSLTTMIKFLVDNEEQMKQMRIRAFSEVGEKYSMDRCADDIYELYSEILGDKS